MHGNNKKQPRPKKIVIYPTAGEGISCGSVTMVMTDENIRLIKIGGIIQLNYELGNAPIDEDLLKNINDEQIVKMQNDLQMQRQSQLN
jgi:hypothetical protein